MEFEAWADSVRGKFTAHYSENYETCYNVELGDITAPVVFTLRNRQPKTYLGFATKNAGLGPEACEFVFVLKEPEFNADALARVQELIARAEKEYIRPGKDHGFTFISVAVLSESADKKSVAALKKYKMRREYYKGGWMLARIAVILQKSAPVCNKDGVDFRDLLKKAVAEDESAK